MQSRQQTLFIGDVDEAGVQSDVLDTRPANGHEVQGEAMTPSDVDEVQGHEAGARSDEADAIVLTEIAVDHEARNYHDVSSSRTINC